MIELNLEEKLIIIAILVSIMEADGVIDPHETQYLDEVIKEFNLKDWSLLEEICDLDFNMVVREYKSFEPFKKDYAMQMFKKMAACDGFVDPREVSIINKL